MTFAVAMLTIVGYEAVALATGDRWPPTITRLLQRRPLVVRLGFAALVGLLIADHLTVAVLP